MELENVASVTGGIDNAGTVSADIVGISVLDVTGFSGGIANSGVLIAGETGVLVGGSALNSGSVVLSGFAGGIANTGTISGEQRHRDQRSCRQFRHC